MSNKADTSTIGGRLRELRESRDLTQDDVAKIFDYSRQNINKFENASDEEISLKSDLLIRYAKHFDVSTDYILGLDGDHKKKSTAELGLSLGLDEKSVLALQMLKQINISDLGINDDSSGNIKNNIDNEIMFTQKGINLLLTLLYDGLIEAKSIKRTPGHATGTIENFFSHIYMYINSVNFGIGNDPKIRIPHFVFYKEQAPLDTELMMIKNEDGGISLENSFHACELFTTYYREKIMCDLKALIKPYNPEYAKKTFYDKAKKAKKKKGGKN